MATSTRSAGKPREQAGREELPPPDGSQRDDFVSVTPYGGEELIADVRQGVTPGQMVDRKLLALLGGGSPGLVAQAGGGPPNPRRVPGGRP